MANYITQTDLEHYRGVALTANGLNTFNVLLSPMNDTIDLYCNRSWNLASPTITEYFDAYTQADPPALIDTFFPKYPVSATAANSSFPRAGGIVSVTLGEVNGAGGTPMDLTYVFNYKTSIKFWNWFQAVSMFNPLGFQAVKIIYNTDDATVVPNPIKLAMMQWMARMIDESQDSGKSAREVMTGPIRVYYAEEKDLTIPPFVKFVLDKYRLTPLDHL